MHYGQSSWVEWSRALNTGLAVVLVATLTGVSFGAELPPQAVKKAIDEYASASKATVGAVIVDVRTNKAVVKVNPDETFIPASNQKLLTSAFALARLGVDFEFTTAVHLIGDDLHIIGSGDPTLGDPTIAASTGKTIYDELDAWTRAIAQVVTNPFAGDIVVHSSFTPSQETPLESFRQSDWPEDQYHNWYVAPVAGLNFHNNCFDVTFVSRDGTIEPVVSPYSRLIGVENRTKIGPRHVWSLRINSDDSQLAVVGTIRAPSNSPLSVSANHPPLMAGRVLGDRLERAGVEFRGTVRYAGAPTTNLPEPVAKTTSPITLAIARANKQSLNMAAEALFLSAGDGTWAGSGDLMTRTLKEHFGIGDGIVVRDGSGLSRGNRVTPRAMSRMLMNFVRRDDFVPFAQTLAISGVDGTLKDRLDSPLCRAKVLAKTGYILGVSCLSGYVLDNENRPSYAFSILANNVPPGQAWRTKQMQDAICELMVRAANVNR